MPNRKKKTATPRNSRGALAFALVLVLTLGGCSSSPERQLLTDFFLAARLNDTTALATLGEASFNPRTQGTVQDFDIVDQTESNLTKQVIIDAQVRLPDGEMVQQRLTVSLRRATQVSDWRVAGIR